MDDSAITCDEVIDADADAEAMLNDEAKSNNEENFNQKKATCKTQHFYVLHSFFNNYFSIIDSCW